MAEFLNRNFPSKIPFSEKDKYIWEIISLSKDKERVIYHGSPKEMDKCDTHIKQLKINFQNCNQMTVIIREIYFLVLFSKIDYIVKLDDILFDDEEKTQYIYLIFKGNTISLDKLLAYSLYEEKYFSNKDLIRWIIFQIACGIYILHNNGVIHNNINPRNILINEIGEIFLSDFGAAIYKDEDCYSYSKYYSPPELILDKNINRTQKSDIWSFGLTVVNIFFSNKIFSGLNEGEYLKSIYSRFDFKDNLTHEEMISINHDKSKSSQKIKLTEEEIYRINNNDVLDIIYNTLLLNPEKRYNIEDILNSKYFDIYNKFKPLKTDFPKINVNYKLIYEYIGQEEFVDILKKLKQNN